jgi:hypothetical protein
MRLYMELHLQKIEEKTEGCAQRPFKRKVSCFKDE